MRERLLLQFAQAAPAYANRLVAKFFDYKYNKVTANKFYTFLRVFLNCGFNYVRSQSTEPYYNYVWYG
jgi:hypothetical protein